MSGLINSNAFTVIEGRPVTSSLKVAEYFGKQHFHVLRDIENLIEKRPDLRKSNFGLTEKISKLGATTRKVPFYWMDRKGFCILAMGFTGAKALDFKIAFYDEFERMEKALQVTACEVTPSEESADQYLIRKAVSKRVKSSSVHYQTIYNALYNRFRISSYKQLRHDQIREALTFIECVDLRVPVDRSQIFDENGRCKFCGLHPIPKGWVLLAPEFAERTLAFVYYWRYLYRDDLEIISKLLDVVQSPHAARFWEAVHDINLGRMESLLEQQGYAMKDFKPYQHWLANH